MLNVLPSYDEVSNEYEGELLVDKQLKLRGKKFYTNLNGVNKNNIDKEMMKNASNSNIRENDEKRFKNQNDM